MRIVSIRDEEQNPYGTKAGQRLPPLGGKHSVELNGAEESSNSHYDRKPGVTEPDGNKEDREEDCCANYSLPEHPAMRNQGLSSLSPLSPLLPLSIRRNVSRVDYTLLTLPRFPSHQSPAIKSMWNRTHYKLSAR